MPEQQVIEKAMLQEIVWSENGTIKELGTKRMVQFNPQSLSLSHSNKKAEGNQSGKGAIQFMGKGTSKLSLELLFDTSVTDQSGTAVDVRTLVQPLLKYIKSTEKENNGEGKGHPPGLRFLWGSFQFNGVVDSIDETLDYFSNDGKPLRATVSLSVTELDIDPEQLREAARRQQASQTPPGAQSAGTQPQEPVREGESVQQTAARQGRQDEWKSIASANNIENPRQPPAGSMVNMNG